MVKISVVIPVYNAEKFLDESISSLLNQTFSDIELICVNDGSTDNSLEKLNQFAQKDNRIKVISKENGGCGSARNKALENAIGKYVYFFDPDDYLVENSFELLYENAENNKSDLVLSKIARFRDGEPVDFSIPGFELENVFKNVDFDNFSFTYKDIKKYVLNASYAPWTKLYRKEFLDKYGDFYFPLNVAFDDVVFHVKSLLRADSISFVPEFFYRYRLSNPNSVNNTSSNGIDIFKICDLVEEFLRKENFFEDFKEEFVLFKITQILFYIFSTGTEEYFQCAKTEFLNIKYKYFSDKTFNKKIIDKQKLIRFNYIIQSKSFDDFKMRLKLYKNEEKNKKLSNENINLKKKNKELTNQNKNLKSFKNKIEKKSNIKLNHDIDSNINNINSSYKILKSSSETLSNSLNNKFLSADNIFPLISIILPSYNVVEYIEECLLSVLNQTLQNIEIICVDAQSTDGTLEILEEYAKKDSRINLLISEEKSYGHQMNMGISSSRGEYIGIVETDDYIKEDMFETLYDLTENATVDIAKVNFWHLRYDNHDDVDFIIDGTKKNLPKSKFTIFDDENILNGHPCIWAAIYSRKFLVKNNITFMEEPGGAWVDNPFLFETMLLAKSIKYLDEPYYYYRESNPTSSTNQLTDLSLPMKRINNIMDILDENGCNYEKVLKALYVRIFWHIKDIQNRDNFESQKEKACSSIYQIVERMDEDIVEKYFNKNDQDVYHNSLSYSKYMKNILLVSSDNNKTSGAFLSMANLARFLKNKYHLNVTILLPYDNHGTEVLDSFNLKHHLIHSEDWVIPLSKQNDENTLKEIERKKNVNKKAILEIQDYLKNEKIDLVHINTTYSYVAAKACLNEKIPFVWHLREFLEEDQSNTLWDRKEGNNLINKADKIIAISNSIYDKYESIFDENKLVFIPNGIDARRFYKPNKKIFESGLIKLIFVGGFEDYKGQIEFSKACVKLYQKGYTNFEVNFVGLGSQNIREEVENNFKNAKMQNINFLGYKSDVENYYKQTDISFTCAKSEAFGRTTVEAMLSGNLVIGADTAGTKELIKHEKTGLLYEQGNPDDLCEKILWAMKYKEKSKEIANTGRKYMHKNMTAEKNADRIYELYEEFLN